MKKYFAILSVALLLGLLVGMLGFATVGADPLVGNRIQLPRIDVDGGWATWIQVFNKGTADTYAEITFWGDPGLCPPDAEVPVGTLCRLVKANGVWTVKHDVPAGAKSAIVDTFTATGCTGDPGEDVAVTVDRIGPNDYTTPTTVASVYTGISDEMHGAGPTFTYFVPYVMLGYNNLDTVITIQNSGEECVSGWLYFSEQGICNLDYTYHIDLLAPGEATRITAADLHAPVAQGGAGIPCDWLGSGYIQSSMPLGIIVDQISDPDVDACASTDRGMMLTWRAMPYKQVGEVEWDTAWYADILFREWSGWNSSIQVQNLTQISIPTFVTVDIRDQSGDEILFLADWVLANCATTFYMPVVTDLGFDYAGAAVIQSHAQVDWPGDVHDGEPIFVIVDLKKPGTGQGGAYNAHPKSEKEWMWDVALPHLSKGYQDVTSLIALRNNSNCNKIKPRIDFKTEEGETICFVNSFWLQPKHVKLIDLDNMGCLPGGWVGAAEVVIPYGVEGYVEQLCDVDNDGHVDNEPIMPSVVVVNRGTGPGDTTRVYEGFPMDYKVKPCYGDIMGKVHSIDPCENPGIDAAEPIQDVTVTISELHTGTTNSTGNYEVEDVASGTGLAVEFAKTGFLTYTTATDLDCGEDEVLDAELLCLGEVGVKVMSYVSVEDVSIIAGASVEYSKPYPTKAAHYGDYYRASGTTDNTGVLTVTVPIISATGTFTVSAPGIAETGAFTWMQMVNDGVDRPDPSIFGGTVLNSRIYSGTTAVPVAEWYGFNDDSCANIANSDRTLNNQDPELLLCRFGTVAGSVSIGGVMAPGRLVEVIQDGVVVGSETTSAAGDFIITGIPTGCFSTGGCKDYSVWVEGVLWDTFTWGDCGALGSHLIIL